MKKITLFVLTAFILFSCNKEKTVAISGKIVNPLDENVVIQINYLDQSDTIALAEDGTFSTKIDVADEYLGALKNGNFRLPVYFVPGASINIEMDIDELKNKNSSGVKITGEGSEPTAFMFRLKDKGIKEGVRELLKMQVDSFDMKMDNAIKTSNDAIENFQKENNPSAKFIESVQLMQKISFAWNYKYFINYHHRSAPQDTLPIPDYFQEYVDEIPVDDYEKCKEIPEYQSWVTSHLQAKIQKTLSADSTLNYKTIAFAEKNIDEIIALDAPVDIKDIIGYRLVSSYSYKPDSIKAVYKARYKELIKKQKYIDNFENIIAAIEKTKPGSVAPTFNYPDINGNMVSSESLKGKVIYIDVWATWCGPCKGEIPYLKKLEEELRDKPIAFVSISVDEDKKAWEKMVKEKDMHGYQLYAKEAWDASIVKDYAIRGIPNFMIIDKEGIIVESNASRPSTPTTKEKLLKLAEQ